LTMPAMSGMPTRSPGPGTRAWRKPMAAARRVSLYEREIRVHLGTAAIEVLFDASEVLSEGQRQGLRYFGSTMIGIDLAGVRAAVREDCDAADVRRVAELLENDPRVAARARALAIAAAEKLAGGRLAGVEVDSRARVVDGERVELILDLEGQVAR